MGRRFYLHVTTALAIALVTLPRPSRAQEGEAPDPAVKKLEPAEFLFEPGRLDPLEPLLRRRRQELAERMIEARDEAVLVRQLIVTGIDDRDDEEGDEEEEASSAPDQTISDSVFAHWVFGMEDIRDARRRLKEVLGTRVEEVESTYQVSPAHRRKLELAGKGDIERFFDHVAEKRKELDDLQVNEHKTRRFVLTELIPLRAKMRQGPFGEGSLFAKTLNKLVNEKQLARKTQG